MNKTYIYLFFIIILAFILRLYNVDKIPPSLYWDEAAIALDAKSISLTAKDHHGNFWLQPIFPSWGDYKLPGYILTATPFFKVLAGRIELAVRLPSVIAGTLTVLVVYFLIGELFKLSRFKDLISKPKNLINAIALIASFLLATSPWHLQFSRAAFEGNLALLFNSLALLFFLKAARKSQYLVLRIFWILASLLLAILAIYTYYSARIVLPIILFIAFIFFWKRNVKNIFIFILFIGLFFGFTMPLRNSNLSAQANQLRLSTKNILSNEEIIIYSAKLIEQDKDSFIARKIHHRFLYIGKQLLFHYFDHFSLNFLILKGDNNLRHSTGRIGVLLFISAFGLIYGEYLFFKKNIKLFLFLNICLLITFLPAAVPYEVPHALRSLNAVVFINIISAYGLVQLFKLLKTKKKTFLLYIICLFFFIQFIFYLHDYYIHYPGRSFLDWQGGYKQAIKAVNKDYDRADNVVFTNAYGRPYLYFLLYSDYSISKFQEYRQTILAQNPQNYSETFNFDKITFKNIEFEKDKKSNKVMLIGTPAELSTGDKIDNINNFKIWKNY